MDDEDESCLCCSKDNNGSSIVMYTHDNTIGGNYYFCLDCFRQKSINFFVTSAISFIDKYDCIKCRTIESIHHESHSLFSYKIDDIDKIVNHLDCLRKHNLVVGEKIDAVINIINKSKTNKVKYIDYHQEYVDFHPKLMNYLESLISNSPCNYEDDFIDGIIDGYYKGHYDND